MKLNVYGKMVEVVRDDGYWKVFYLGNEGKKRLAIDIFVPSSTKGEDVVTYIADLCHEWATPLRNEVKRLD